VSNLILNIFNRIESIYTKREREEWKRIKLTYKFDILAPTTLPPKFLKFLKLVIYIYTYIHTKVVSDIYIHTEIWSFVGGCMVTIVPSGIYNKTK
jgi:hypothetical protein